MKKRIGIVFGGRSVEHEISILSCMQILKAIDREKYDAIAIYMDKHNRFFVGPYFDDVKTFQKNSFKKREILFKQVGNNQVKLVANKGMLPRKFRHKIDCIIAVVHGSGVEDGTLAGYFNVLDVPYSAANVLAASVAQDKVIMKKVFRSSNIPTIKAEYFTKHEWIHNREKWVKKINKLGYPVIIKPSTLGSSIGITIVMTEEELAESINLAFEYDERILIERALQRFREFNCAVLGKTNDEIISEIEEVVTQNNLLTFEDKYANQDNEIPLRIIPAEIDTLLAEKIRKLTSKINRLLMNSGISRIDYLYCLEEEKLYVNEINTIPGSLAFYLFDGLGIDFKMLITELIERTIKYKYLNDSYRTSFDTNILSVSKIFKGK